jgi:hypothetical protein
VLWVKRRKPLTRDPSSEFAGWVKQEVQGLGGNAWVFIDEIGVGAGVLDNARRMGLNARGFAASKRSHQPRRFSNIRAECWWKVREKLQKGELSLPDDHLLTGDLTTARYAFDELGRIQLEDKDEMRKRLGRSPDSGDALAMTFASVALSADEEEPTSAQVTTEKSRWHLEKRATASRWKRLRGR